MEVLNMKKCNVCQSIVDTYEECPICGNTLTYEPPVMEDREHFVFNKYFALYLLKNMWFAIFCTIVAAVMLILAKDFTVGHLIIGIFLLIATYLFSIFQRTYESLVIQWCHSEDYSKRKAAAAKYAVGSAALIYFLLAIL